MIPFGASLASSAAGVLKRRITEYTLHSRIRRAITCVYCEPKSKMTICSGITSKNELCALLRPLWREKTHARPEHRNAVEGATLRRPHRLDKSLRIGRSLWSARVFRRSWLDNEAWLPVPNTSQKESGGIRAHSRRFATSAAGASVERPELRI